MADPRQKSLELPGYLTRILPMWQTPQWMEAERWRRVLYNLPAAMVCRDVLISDLMASDWEVRAKDDKEEDALADDIEYYADVLNPDMGFGLVGFDAWIEKGAQDLLTVPAGWNNEIVRWLPGDGPLSRPNPKGHVYQIVYMDAATVFPTYDKEFPLGQRIRQDAQQVVYFQRDEIARIISAGRPEIERWGYGMAPPERVYLALTLLYRGDQYYANLLLDTPEAGILDLMDMSQKAATEWVQSFKTLQEGIDPMKIGVGYEHEKPWAWIPFGRPPTELMFKDAYLAYGSLTAAGYGLTLTDIGMGEPQKTLAGSIRDERRSQRSGFATTREKVRGLINNEILPDYLEFVWKTKDEERNVQRARAFTLASQALKNARDAGFISRLEGQQQLVKDGHLTIEVEPPEEPPPMPALPPQFGGNGGQANEETERVPASEGGRGDITGKAELGEERIASVPPDSAKFDQLAQVMRDAFAEVLRQADRPRLLKLVKAATRAVFPATEKALTYLTDGEMPTWLEQRSKLWFGEHSEFSDLPDVEKQAGDILDVLEKLLAGDPWWLIPVTTAAAIELITRLAYEEGATEAAQVAQELLYTEGLVKDPTIIGLNFQLTNPETLARLEKSAAQLVRRVNDGTKFYLKRIITSGVEEGLASPSIAQMIRDGADVEEVLKQAGYTEGVVKRVQEEIGAMTDARINSIVNTEIAKAETDGRVGQWEHMGLTKKRWVHTGATGHNDPCPVCVANIDLGFVDMNFMYESVFGPGDTLGPPAHPQVDHCHIEFSEAEMMEKAGTLEVWTGV
jgi:hypothetical protein